MRRTSLGCALALALLACDRSPSTPQSGAATPSAETKRSRADADETKHDKAEASPEPQLPQAGPLHYHEVVLGGATADEALPMIVAIHGLGDTPQNFAGLFATFPEKARLILPRAIDPTEGGGFSWFPIRARNPDVDALSEGIQASADKVAQAIEMLEKDKPTLGKPIVTGFSQGGMLTFTLAVHHPERVGAAVAVGGWLPPPLWPQSKPEDTEVPALWALHGTDDNAVAFEPTSEAVQHLSKLGYEVKLQPYEGVRHVITPEIQRDLYDRLTDAVREQRAAGDSK